MRRISALSAAMAAPLGAIFILGAVGAQAQGTGTPAQKAADQKKPAHEEAIEEIVVTARFRSEALQQTPLAITAITADVLEQRQITQASDVGYLIPNASLRPAHSAFGPTLTAFIRGVGQADYNFAFEPGVAIYVDDVYYPTTMATQFDLMDLERVEALRGPQGTLFGRGAIGGAIRYISKKAQGDNSGFLQATGGEFSRVDLRAGYDFSLVPNKLFMRVTGVHKQSDGYQKVIDFACANPSQAGSLPRLTSNSNCELGTTGGTDLWGVRTNLRYVANDRLEFTLSADYQKDQSETHADTILSIGQFAPPADFWNNFMTAYYGVSYDSRFVPKDPYTSYASFQDPYSGLKFPRKSDLTQKGVSGTVDWAITDAVSAKLIVAWRNWKSTFGGDADGSPLGLDGASGSERLTYTTTELRFSGQALDKLVDWTVGGFFYDGTNGDGSTAQSLSGLVAGPDYYLNPAGSTNGFPNGLQINSRDLGRFQDRSGFAHAVFNVTDKLRFTGGIRFSSDKKRDLNLSMDSFSHTLVTQSVISEQTSFDWLAGIDYRFTPDFMLYFSASTGFRPPAYNPRTFQASQFTAINGEKLTAFELGEHAEFFDKRLRVNAAGFYSDYSKRMLQVAGIECFRSPVSPYPCIGPVVVPLITYINAPAKIYGAELELTVRPIDPLLISISGGYTSFDAQKVTFQGVEYDGVGPNNQAAYVPEYNISANVQYTQALPNGATLTPRWNTYMQARICSGQLPSSCTDSYILHNMSIEYATEDREWVFTAGLNNVMDKVYYYNTFDLSQYGRPVIEAQIAPPRTWFIQLTRYFGGK